MPIDNENRFELAGTHGATRVGWNRTPTSRRFSGISRNDGSNELMDAVGIEAHCALFGITSPITVCFSSLRRTKQSTLKVHGHLRRREGARPLVDE